MKTMRKYNSTMVVVIFLLSTALITSVHPATLGSTSLSTQGNIDYNGHMGLPLLYSTDFETVTSSGSTLSNLGADYYLDLEGGGTFWVEGYNGNQLPTGVTPHDGSTRCLGLSTPATSSTPHRSEFAIKDINSQFGVITEYYVSAWLYLPPGWTVSDWYSIGDPIAAQTGNWLPQSETTIIGGTSPQTVESWGTPGSSTDPYQYIASIPGFPPINRWFKYEFYIKLDPTTGIIKVWIDGRVLCDVSGIRTINYAGQPMMVYPADIYHYSTTTAYQLWVDDLEIYGR